VPWQRRCSADHSLAINTAVFGSRDLLDQLSHVQLAIGAVQRVCSDAYLAHAMVLVIVNMQTGIPLPYLEEIDVWTVLTGLVTWGLIVVTDAVAGLPDRR